MTVGQSSSLLECVLSNSGDLSHISAEEEVRVALRARDEALYSVLSGRQRTALAKALSWDSFEFEPLTESRSNPGATILETCNNTTLAVLAPDGQVYQLGDVIRFEQTKSSVWYGTRSRTTRTYEHQIDYLSDRTASISRNPTYSNTSGDSPTAHFSRTEIEMVEKSDLDDYRKRFTESLDVNVPERVNGWELVETTVDNKDSNYFPTGLITRLQWCNGESTHITAQWRGSFNTWYLAVPVDGTVTEANVDEYLYEVDVPQGVVRTETIISLAEQAMKQLDPADFEDPYDLRNPSDIEDGENFNGGPAPVDIPEVVGDWHVVERRRRRIQWENRNDHSPWRGFEVKLDARGGSTVKNVVEREVHDRRAVERYYANGDPFPDNVDKDYAFRRREMFEDNWAFAIAFMIQTSRTAVPESMLKALDTESPLDTSLDSVDHELDADVQKTMDRQDGNIFAYTTSS